MIKTDHRAYIVFSVILLMVDKNTGRWLTGRFMLGQLTGLKPITAYSSLKRLQNKWGVISINSNNKYSVISVLNWDKYQKLENGKNNKVTTKQQQSNNKVTLNKNKELRIKKDISTNVDISGTKQIVEILEMFEKTVNPTINYGNKTNRKAAGDLIKKFGLERTKQFVKLAVDAQGKDFAPTITTPYQLYNKLAELRIFYERNKSKQAKILKL